MCGALAIRAPERSNTAQEKSSRSLMFTEWAVFCSTPPISSAMAMNRLANSSRRTGSGAAPTSVEAGRRNWFWSEKSTMYDLAGRLVEGVGP